MFVWRKRASTVWLAANEAAVREVTGQRLAVISRPGGKTAIAEIAGSSRRDLEKIRSRFGGTIERLSCNWLKEFSRAQKSAPIKIGKRLIIYRSVTSKNKNTSLLIPVGRAFGTGEHATTAMSLRLLEQCTRRWGAQAGSPRSPEPERTPLDIGTGSGILALAAARFGARRVIAIDHDPVAIATARANARRNKLDNIDFRVGDVRRWQFPPRIRIMTPNLSSALLIEIVPKLKRAQWLILSGILHGQEAQLIRALERNGIIIVETRRRGKWIAILAGGSAHSMCAVSEIISDALREAPQDAELSAQDVRATPGMTDLRGKDLTEH